MKVRTLIAAASLLLASAAPALAQEKPTQLQEVIPVEFDLNDTFAEAPSVRQQSAVVSEMRLNNKTDTEPLRPMRPKVEWIEQQRINLGNGFYLAPSQLRFEVEFSSCRLVASQHE